MTAVAGMLLVIAIMLGTGVWTVTAGLAGIVAELQKINAALNKGR